MAKMPPGGIKPSDHTVEDEGGHLQRLPGLDVHAREVRQPHLRSNAAGRFALSGGTRRGSAMQRLESGQFVCGLSEQLPPPIKLNVNNVITPPRPRAKTKT